MCKFVYAAHKSHKSHKDRCKNQDEDELRGLGRHKASEHVDLC